LQKVVAERFEILNHARSGGMGEVFRSVDRKTGRKVAVKVLSTSSPRIVERFLREAQILAELDHPAIVRHVAHGMDNDVPYLAMEWVDGETLAERVKRAPLTIDEAITLAERLSEALGLVHARGIVHRDVKPGNIVLESRGIDGVRLLDFGIAHVLEAGGELTRTGDLLGTPGYMAPEQASGANVDARADVFALGCVIFRALAGRTPFPGNDPLAVAIKLLLEDAPRLSSIVADVPRGLDDLVAKMLARSKEDRPRDGAAVRHALSALLDPATVTQAISVRNAPTLGQDERRVMSLVLARSPDWDPTLAAIEALRDVLDEPVAKHGAILDVLADGSIVITAKGGAPHDVATRAARCALALREELPDAIVVVSTGHGVMEQDAPVGELVDHAVAMLEEREKRAAAGASSSDEPRTLAPIHVDPMSAGLLGGRFEIDGDSKALSLRGERRVDRARTLLGKPTPFVGRTRELATLDAMLAECVEESVSRAVLVTANPGVGKSRLREEYLRRARERDDARVWLAHADPVSQGAPLGMVAQLLRAAFGIAQRDPIGQKQRKIVSAIEGLGIDDPRRVAEFLGEIVGVPFPDEESVELRAARRDPQLLATRMRYAFEQVVKAQCARGPLLIVLEDLHWADAASVRLVDAVLGSAAALPLLVIALARPEVSKVFPSLFVDRGLQEIRLLELSRRAAMELVKKVLGSAATEATTEIVVERAQGNAFFLEELIRAVAEGREALPETLVAMVEARLDELDAISRKVLRAAAVYGEEATFGGVHALTGGDAHEIADVLEKLSAAEYLSRTTPGGSRGEVVYLFRHAIVREAAYAMLTDDDRKLGHRLAGEWLSTRPDVDLVVLAEHFDRGGDEIRARGYYQKAAEQALARNDLHRTLELATRAIELGLEGRELAECRSLQGEANIWKGDPVALAQAAETLATLPPGTARWFRTSTGLLFAAGQVADFGEVVRSIRMLREAKAVDDDRSTASYEAWACSMATWILVLIGMYDLANEFYDRACALEGKIDEAGSGWVAIAGMFVNKYMRRDPWAALASTLRARERFREIGDFRLLVLCDVLHGSCLVDLGAYEEAQKILDDTLVVCERFDLQAARGDVKRWLGHTMEGLKRFPEALVLEEEAEVEIKNALIYRGAAKAARAWILAELGRLDEAAERAQIAAESLAFAPSHHAHVLAWLSRIELRRGNREKALLVAQQAEQIVKGLGATGAGETMVYVALVDSLEAAGDFDKARKKLRRGREVMMIRADNIPEPRYRACFLERVPEHVWLMTHEVPE